MPVLIVGFPISDQETPLLISPLGGIKGGFLQYRKGGALQSRKRESGSSSGKRLNEVSISFVLLFPRKEKNENS
jgi:hypothetical protein